MDDLAPELMNSASDARKKALIAEARARRTPKEPFNLLKAAGAVRNDVVEGGVETPMAIVSGVRDALQEVLDLTDKVSDPLDKLTAKTFGVLPALQITDPETGNLSLKVVNKADDPESVGTENLLPEVRQPDTNTGKFIEGASQFLTGFAGAGAALKAGKVLQGLGAGRAVARGAAQGALADFAVFDPHEERLSNLVESVPALSNPVTEYLAAQEDDGEIEGRLKNVIEGAGLGVATEGILAALRGTRKVRSAKKSLEEALAEPAEITADRIRGEAIQTDFDAVAAQLETPLFDRKIEAADKITSEASGDFAALSEAATRWRDAVKTLQPERFVDEGDLKALDGVDFNEVDSIVKMAEHLRTPAAKPERLFQFVGRHGGIKDVDGWVRKMIGGDQLAFDKSGAVNPRGKTRIVNDTDAPRSVDEKGIALPAADLDTMAELAWEAGYFHNTRIGATLDETGARPTEDDLVELLRRDILGEEPVYRQQDVDVVADLDARQKIEQELDALGVDWTDKSPKRLRARVEELAALQNGNPRTKADLDAEAASRNASGAGFLSVRQRADLGGEEIYVNFAKIDSADDVKSIIGQMADAFAPDVNAARGGARVSVREQKLTASQVDAFEVLNARRQGDPLNAAQSFAVRQLWASSAAKLKDAALAAHASPTPGAVLAFRKMMAVHHAIQREVISARTETARALQMWSVPAGDTALMAKAIDDVLTKNGGVAAAADLAKKISELDPSDLRALDEAVEKGAAAKTAEALEEVSRFMLLSGPQTHIVNGLGNTLVMLNEMGERAVAAQMAKLLGRQGSSVDAGEVAAMAQGMLAGFRDTMRYTSKVLRGRVVNASDEGVFTGGLDKVDSPNVGAVSSENFNIDGGTAFGRTVDVVGTIIRAPTSALGAADTLFKTMNWRAELYAQAHRVTSQEVRSGKLAKADVATRTAELLDKPPTEMLEAARKAAVDRTFTTPPGKRTRALLELRNGVRIGALPVGHLLLPFVNTPANIMKYAFIRTPLAPMFSEYRQAMNAGGAAQELALARMAGGTMIGLLAADMTMNGQMSGGGPIDPRQRQNLRRDGWQPYSVKVGDRWFAYNRLDPLGMTLGLGADAAEIFANTDWTDDNAEEADEAAALMIGSIGSVMMSKTYLQGVADFTEYMSDPKRYGETYLQRLTGTFTVPAAAAQLRRVEDPVIRDSASVMDAIKNRVPGLSKELPARLDLWGREISYQSGLGVTYDAFSPVYSRKSGGEAIDGEMVRLRVDAAMPQRSIEIGGQAVSLRNRPEIYQRYVQLAGNEIKGPGGLGAKDLLNAIIEGKHPQSRLYESLSDGPDGGKSVLIKNVVTKYRQAARAKLLQEYPELISEAERQMQERDLNLPVR